MAELGPNEPGEIVTHGPQVFLGYWNRPEETEAAFIEIEGKRFLRTSDIGYYDEDGYFFFTDRPKRMVNVSGLKVWPAEVEAILHGHPDIAEACIVADPDPRTGEAVRAVIAPRAGKKKLPISAVTEWCRQNMAAYKVPKKFEFRDSLPRSGSGKVLWKDL
jgi:fatty-acyl-CoA synthase